MTVPVDDGPSMGASSTMVRIRRKLYGFLAQYCGTVMTVPYIRWFHSCGQPKQIHEQERQWYI